MHKSKDNQDNKQLRNHSKESSVTTYFWNGSTGQLVQQQRATIEVESEENISLKYRPEL